MKIILKPLKFEMKWTNANKGLLFALLVVSMIACNTQTVEDGLIGRWQYQSIEKHQQTAIPVGKDDVLEFKSNGRFEYHLALANKHKSGEWQLKDKTLHLTYHQPDTIRLFELDVISKDHLKFHEGEVVFDLNRAY